MFFFIKWKKNFKLLVPGIGVKSSREQLSVAAVAAAVETPPLHATIPAGRQLRSELLNKVVPGQL